MVVVSYVVIMVVVSYGDNGSGQLCGDNGSGGQLCGDNGSSGHHYMIRIVEVEPGLRCLLKGVIFIVDLL